jgi:hypothetical protein
MTALAARRSVSSRESPRRRIVRYQQTVMVR